MRAVVILGATLAVMAAAKTGRGETVDVVFPQRREILTLGLRAGAAAPFGRAYAGSGALGDALRATTPIGAQIGWSVVDRVTIGFAGWLGPTVANDCTAPQRCSGSYGALGVYIEAAFVGDRRPVRPWLKLGLGLEHVSLQRTTPSDRTRIGMTGPFGALELGADFELVAAVRVGPFLAGSLGRFSRIEVNGARMNDFEPDMHAWLTAGIGGRIGVIEESLRQE